MEFLWFILIGLVAGWLAGYLMKGGGFGIVGDIVVGVVGALLGGFLFRTFGVSAGGGLIGSLIVATIGACVSAVLAPPHPAAEPRRRLNCRSYLRAPERSIKVGKMQGATGDAGLAIPALASKTEGNTRSSI